ncbi:VOC family protein [Paenibacillus tarimensis]
MFTNKVSGVRMGEGNQALPHASEIITSKGVRVIMSAIQYEGIHHTAIVVTDLERAKKFYGELLGLTESRDRPAFEFGGAWYEIGSMQIHLIVHEGARTLRNTTAIDSRDGHFAIRVKEMQPVLERLKRFGVSFRDNPNSITGWHQVFVTDPDGNVIEFNAG